MHEIFTKGAYLFLNNLISPLIDLLSFEMLFQSLNLKNVSTFQFVEFGVWFVFVSEENVEGGVGGSTGAAERGTGVLAESQAGVRTGEEFGAGQLAGGNGTRVNAFFRAAQRLMRASMRLLVFYFNNNFSLFIIILMYLYVLNYLIFIFIDSQYLNILIKILDFLDLVKYIFSLKKYLQSKGQALQQLIQF